VRQFSLALGFVMYKIKVLNVISSLYAVA
jgi:hypothetical protein